MCMSVCMCAEARGQHWISASVTLIFKFFKDSILTRFLTEPRGPDWLDQLSNRLQGSTSLHLPRAIFPDAYHTLVFYMDAGDMNAGPYFYTAGTEDLPNSHRSMFLLILIKVT